MFFIGTIVMLLLQALVAAVKFEHWYSLPLFPAQLPALETRYNVQETGQVIKHIPRRIWVAVKDRNDTLPGHLTRLFERNPGWEVNICDNACKDSFMDEHFANTSISAFFHQLNPTNYASKADIWRYCVLYVYGGLYLDDDSDFKTTS